MLLAVLPGGLGDGLVLRMLGACAANHPHAERLTAAAQLTIRLAQECVRDTTDPQLQQVTGDRGFVGFFSFFFVF